MATSPRGKRSPGDYCSCIDAPGADLPDSYFDREQLKIGTRIEMEHTSDPAVAKMIAKQHLREFEDYYIELVKMEKMLEEREKRKGK